MWLYIQLSRIFPRSFTAKVFGIAFIGTHIPLLATVGYALAGRGSLAGQLPVLGLVLVATLMGTFATLLALHAVLKPLFRVEAAMRAFEQDGRAELLPEMFCDEVGRLMQRTNRLVFNVGQKLDLSTLAAETDPLTGVLNRRGFQRRVGTGPVAQGAVVHFDLDRFKAINDTHGHEAGDRVLVAVAKAAQAGLRRGDILARFGGEEFVVFLPGTGSEEARMAAERIRSLICERVSVAGHAVTASLGVAATTDQAEIEALIAQADAATYAAKQAGRNRVRFAPGVLHGLG